MSLRHSYHDSANLRSELSRLFERAVCFHGSGRPRGRTAPTLEFSCFRSMQLVNPLTSMQSPAAALCAAALSFSVGIHSCHKLESPSYAMVPRS